MVTKSDLTTLWRKLCDHPTSLCHCCGSQSSYKKPAESPWCVMTCTRAALSWLAIASCLSSKHKSLRRNYLVNCYLGSSMTCIWSGVLQCNQGCIAVLLPGKTAALCVLCVCTPCASIAVIVYTLCECTGW